MSSLSAREQKILNEIEGDLAAAEPRLARALAAVRHPRRRVLLYTVILVAPLLAGFGLLTLGLIYASVPLITVGIPLAQFSPFAAGYLLLTRSRRPG